MGHSSPRSADNNAIIRKDTSLRIENSTLDPGFDRCPLQILRLFISTMSRC